MTNFTDLEKAKFIAVKYLGISKKTKFEVITKLKKCNIADDIIVEVISYLQDLEYINDLDYVKSYISQNISFLKYSIFEIKYKLKQKGIDSKDYDNCFAKLYDIDYESKVIDKLKVNKLKNLDDMQIKQYLYRRGFSFDY